MLTPICEADAYCEYPKILMPNTNRTTMPAFLEDFMTSFCSFTFNLKGKKSQ